MFLKEQTYICAIADFGSITKAAAHLYISQPALSSYLSSVEATLGAPLFRREGRQYVLTLLGERYVARARVMLNLQDAFNLDLALTLSGALGRIKIGIQARRSPIILAPIMRFFQERYPSVEVQFEEANADGLMRLLDAGKVDFILFTTSDKLPGHIYRTVFREELLLAVPRHHPAREHATWEAGRQYQSLDIHHLQDDTFFMPHTNQSLRATCERLFQARVFRPKRIVEVRNIEAIMTLVASGLGVGFNRASYTRHMNQMNILNKVTYYHVPGECSLTEFALCYRENIDRSPAFTALVDQIVELLADYE